MDKEFVKNLIKEEYQKYLEECACGLHESEEEYGYRKHLHGDFPGHPREGCENGRSEESELYEFIQELERADGGNDEDDEELHLAGEKYLGPNEDLYEVQETEDLSQYFTEEELDELIQEELSNAMSEYDLEEGLFGGLSGLAKGIGGGVKKGLSKVAKGASGAAQKAKQAYQAGSQEQDRRTLDHLNQKLSAQKSELFRMIRPDSNGMVHFSKLARIMSDPALVKRFKFRTQYINNLEKQINKLTSKSPQATQNQGSSSPPNIHSAEKMANIRKNLGPERFGKTLSGMPRE